MSLTPQEQALHELASRELARRRFLPYVQRTVPKYQTGWVHEDVARQLEWFLAEIKAGRNPHMMILMPPRHGKTQQSGMCFPAWALGHVPDLQFISCAYNVSLSGDFSKKVKEQIESPDYSVLFPHVRPDPNNWSVETWSTLNDDGAPANYVAAGVGGGITGKGADILYIDDPCVAEGQRVLTRRGLVAIEHVVVGDYVWTHRSRWRRVTATYNNGEKDVVALFAGAYKVLLTPEHLVYTTAGWVMAQSAENIYGSAVSTVWQDVQAETKGAEVLFPHVLDRFAAGAQEGVRAVRRVVSAAQGHGAEILRAFMRVRRAGDAEAMHLCGLRTDVPVGQGGAEVLHPRVPARSVAGRAARQESCAGRGHAEAAQAAGEAGLARAAGAAMRLLPRGLRALARVPAVLLRCMQGRGPHGAYAGAAQPELPARTGDGRAQQAVQARAVAGTEAERMLRRVWGVGAAGHAPYGREQAEQRAVELGGALQLVPHPVSQAARRGRAVVYDLTVDEDHSFVAEGLVVHNCKNAEEADSKEYMEKLWTWYGSTAYTRLSPRGGVLLVQTPWSDMDLSGRIQNEMAEALRDRDEDTPQFKVVKYQAVAEQYEYRHRETREIIQRHDELHPDDAQAQSLELLRAPGEALHPARYDKQRLMRIKKTMPLRFWSAQFQQNPVPDDGAYFSAAQLRRAPIPEDMRYCRVICPWDFAISEKQTNDYTVGCALVHDPDDRIHVAEIVRFRSGNALEIVNAMIALARRWSHANLTICVEDGQIWRTMKVLFDKRCAEEKFYPSVQVMKPVTDKLARARPLQGRLQHGTVTFNADPSADNWYMTCRSEMLRFPAGAHDDCGTYETLVDCPAGQVMLGALRDGDAVLTYDGVDILVGTVHNHHCTGEKLVLEVALGDGTLLEFTPAHPLLTQRGYVYAGDLTDADYIVRRTLCRSSGTDTNGQENATATTSQPSPSTAHGDGYTNTPTRARSAQSRRAGTYTTATTTKTTTRRKTWSACLPAATKLRIAKGAKFAAPRLSSLRTWKLSAVKPSRPSRASTSGTASYARSRYDNACARFAKSRSRSARKAATIARIAQMRAVARHRTSTHLRSGTRHAPARSAASSSYPAMTASGISYSARSLAATSTGTPTSTSRANASSAAPSCTCPPGMPADTATRVAPLAQARTSTSVPRAGARLYPASEMAMFTAIGDVLTTPEDLSVTQRAMRDTSRQFVKVASIREIGYRATYNFDVAGTRNYTVHGGLVVHNCVDSLAWGVTAATENPAPQRPPKKKLPKSWRDEIKSFGRGAVGGHMTA